MNVSPKQLQAEGEAGVGGQVAGVAGPMVAFSDQIALTALPGRLEALVELPIDAGETAEILLVENGRSLFLGGQ